MSIIIRHQYVEEFEIEQDAEGFLVEPKCPECNSRVNRPKCAFELGGSCPRHGLQDAYIKAVAQSTSNHRFHLYGYDKGKPEPRCALCMKPHSTAKEEQG